MNRLSLRMTREAHQSATPIIYAERLQSRPFFGDYDTKDMTAARNHARESLTKRTAYNEQVKNDLGIEFDFTYLGLQASETDPQWYGDTWKVTGKGDFSLTYRQGVGNRYCFPYFLRQHKIAAFIVPPSVMDILYCIYLDNPHDESFENWCAEYGYNTDSRKAHKIYRACLDQTMSFRRNYRGVNLDDYEPLQNY